MRTCVRVHVRARMCVCEFVCMRACLYNVNKNIKAVSLIAHSARLSGPGEGLLVVLEPAACGTGEPPRRADDGMDVDA